MTPAINALKKARIAFTVLEYEHDPDAPAYGLEAAEKLNRPVEQVFKTLMVESPDGKHAIGIVPVDKHLDLKAIAKAAGFKKAEMAKPDVAQRISGYVVGGISPVGQKRQLKTVIDSSAEQLVTMLVSGGRRGLDIELAPKDLATATRAIFADIGR